MARELHRPFGQRDGGVAAQFGVHRQQHAQVAVHGDRKRIDAAGRDPHRLVSLFRGERDVPLLGGGAGAGDLDGQRRGAADAFAREVVGGGESPAAERQHADAHAHGFGAGDVAGLAVLGGHLALARFDGAHVGVIHAAAAACVQGQESGVFHRGVIRPPSLSCSPEAARGKRVE